MVVPNASNIGIMGKFKKQYNDTLAAQTYTGALK